MSPREYFKGVIWHREPVETPQGTAYRYMVVGMLVTDQPIPELVVDGSEFFDGPIFGVGDLLACVPHRKAKRPLGDAEDVLLSLNDL